MKMPIKTKRFISTFVSSIVLSVALTACSDDEPKKIVTSKSTHNVFDHSHGAEVSDLKKHKFEHDFAKQCVEREVRLSPNKSQDKKKYSKACLCIATRMMKDLTAVEAEKFLVEKKTTQSLKMGFDEAAYFCLQSKAQSPKLFGKR